MGGETTDTIDDEHGMMMMPCLPFHFRVVTGAASILETAAKSSATETGASTRSRRMEPEGEKVFTGTVDDMAVGWVSVRHGRCWVVAG